MHLHLPPALRQNLYYALGIVIMKGVSFFMLPFITHHLSPEEFGRLEILNTLGAVGSVVVGFGLLNTLFRFAGPERTPGERENSVAGIFGLNLLIAGMALSTSLFLAAPLTVWLPAGLDEENVRLMLYIVALEGCIAIPLGWLRLTDKAGLFFVLNTGKALLQAALVLIFLHQGRGIPGILEAGLIAAALLALVLTALQYRDSGIRFPTERLRELLVYSIPLVASGLLGFILTGLDRWILADAVGPAEMARYAVAAKFALLAALLLQPFVMWWSPRRFRVLQEDDGPQTAARFAAMGSAFSLLIVVCVGLTTPLVIEFLLPADYAHAARYAPWLVLLVAIKDSAELLNLGCYTGRYTHAQLGINLAGSLLGLIAMLAMVPLWGVWGAIWALFLAQGLRLALYLVVSQRLLPLPYPTRNLISLAGLALVLLLLGEWAQSPLEQGLLALHGIALMLIAAATLRLLPIKLARATH